MELQPNTTPRINSQVTPRGRGGRGYNLRGDRGGGRVGKRTEAAGNSFQGGRYQQVEPPVRCPIKVPPSEWCGFANYNDARAVAGRRPHDEQGCDDGRPLKHAPTGNNRAFSP